ncbi:MAG: hypothetical protein K0Q74_704 [Gammaproteobacteria bacterium]|nr:hypothetical protein [Gammaproteobacteria bacterium]
MPKRPTILITILILLFTVPLLIAFFLAKEKDPLSTHTTNRGTLISPPLDFSTLALKDKGGQAVSQKTWKGKWLILYAHTAGSCDTEANIIPKKSSYSNESNNKPLSKPANIEEIKGGTEHKTTAYKAVDEGSNTQSTTGAEYTKKSNGSCDKNLYYMRQIRTATGKDSRRVVRAILTFSPATSGQYLQNALRLDFPGTLHFVVSQDAWQRFIATNPSTRSMQNAIFLVDPLGNVMMMYPHGTPPMDIFKDLSRLLKLSKIG